MVKSPNICLFHSFCQSINWKRDHKEAYSHIWDMLGPNKILPTPVQLVSDDISIWLDVLCPICCHFSTPMNCVTISSKLCETRNSALHVWLFVDEVATSLNKVHFSQNEHGCHHSNFRQKQQVLIYYLSKVLFGFFQ